MRDVHMRIQDSFLIGAAACLLLVSGCGQKRLEAENAALKTENSALKAEATAAKTENSEFKTQLADLKKVVEAQQARLEREEAKRKEAALEREQAEAVRKQEEAKRKVEQAEEERRAQITKKAQSLNGCFERIELKMKGLLDEQRDFAYRSRSQMDATESRLNELANAKKQEIGELIIELKELGLDDANTRGLEQAVRDLVRNYTLLVLYTKMAFALASYEDKEGSSEYARKAADVYKEELDVISTVRRIKAEIAKDNSGTK